MLARLVSLLVAVHASVLAMAQPNDGQVQRPDVTLHYTSVGTGKPLVILAGGPGQDVKQLAGIYNDIKDLRRCVLFDQRGTGRSVLSKIDASTIKLELYIEDLEALRKSLKLDKLSLLGHSWGSMLALAYGVKYPNNVDELILVSSGPIAVERLQQAGDVINFRRALLNVQGELKEDQELLELRPFFYDQKKAEAFARRNKEGEVASKVSHLLIPELIRTGFDLRPGAKALRCRGLIVQGRHDAMPESFVLEMQSCIPGAQLNFIEKAGHFPWIEQPESFSSALRAFLRSSQAFRQGG